MSAERGGHWFGARRAARFAALTLILLWTAGGCLSGSSSTTPATSPDPQQATPDYWLSKPAAAEISHADFYRLWNACRAEAHDRFFLIDREDYREGLLTTQPMISKQAMEFWRRDVVTSDAIAQSTLATIRRTVRFDLKKQPDGTFIAQPRVLVERFASAERRMTAINEYHAAFSGPRAFGDTETDQGISLPTDYWYATGRDEALESDLAAAIEKRLKR